MAEESKSSSKQDVLRLLPRQIRMILDRQFPDREGLQEIRLRIQRPLIAVYMGQEHLNREYVVTVDDIRETVECISSYSLYAFEDEIKRGFLTVPGGHRVGIAGKVVLEGGEVQCIRNISFLNIRLAHEKKGCAEAYLPKLCENGEVYHTLIVSPPMGGKTTLLRDLIRCFSNRGHTVSVIDERSEIAGSYMGVPGNDVGIRTDVLDRCPKALGMEMAIRSMAPEIVAVDEIGGRKDFDAVREVFHCGCKILATMHGKSVEDLLMKPFFVPVFQEGIFQRYVVRGEENGENRWKIYDENGRML